MKKVLVFCLAVLAAVGIYLLVTGLSEECLDYSGNPDANPSGECRKA